MGLGTICHHKPQQSARGALHMHFDAFLKTVCADRDLDWRKYRRASQRKVLDRIYALGLKGYGQYARYLEAHPQEADELPNLLRVTVSRFFRERACWLELAERIFPCIVSRSGDKEIRALSLGSCGGEEPYSLALLWMEHLQPRFPGHSLSITGAELDKASLVRAEEAAYGERTLREAPGEMKSKWFCKQGETYRLHPRIKSMVRFEELDLLKDRLPEGQHLLLCRYLVFTYFTGERALRMGHALKRALKPEGALMIGRKEGLAGSMDALFRPLGSAGCFFQGRP